MRGRKRINNLTKVRRETSSSSAVIQLNNLSVESEERLSIGARRSGNTCPRPVSAVCCNWARVRASKIPNLSRRLCRGWENREEE